MTLLDKLKNITTFVLDVDGVLTDGTVYVLDDGQQVRRMSIRDGYVLQLAVKKGYRVLIISGGHSPAVMQRLNKLGITDVLMSVTDKKAALIAYLDEHRLSTKEVLYMGDDIPDYFVMQDVGFPCSPSDAAPEIRKISAYVASKGGGRGCVREVMEKVLRLHGHWEMETGVPSK